MDGLLATVRQIVSDILERIRRLVIGTGDVSPIFRELVRNGGFERPVIERNHWSRKFVPATDGGWSQTLADRHNHLRSDGSGASGSNQHAWLRQSGITQNLKTAGLAGSTLDVSLQIGGDITVTLGASRHSWKAADAVPTGLGGRWRDVSFRHTVVPGDVPSLQLRIQGDSPQAFVPGTDSEIVYDFVDAVSVIAWPPETVAPEPVYAQIPGLATPIRIHHEP